MEDRRIWSAAAESPLMGNYIVDGPKRNPKGCKESSRWSESAETTGSDDETNRTPEGCQIYAMNIPQVEN